MIRDEAEDRIDAHRLEIVKDESSKFLSNIIVCVLVWSCFQRQSFVFFSGIELVWNTSSCRKYSSRKLRKSE